MKKTILILVSLAACYGTLVSARDKRTSVFGTTERSESALIGILYDFKQNQKREPIPMDRHIFERQVEEFIDKGFDEGMLNKYYRVPRALYTTELMIDTINADSAPKAFGVEKTVQPQKWMVHYKGQVSPPEDGVYRFLGDSDDFVAVAVNGKTVLVNVTPGTGNTLKTKWYAKEKADLKGKWGGDYTAGDWFEAKAGKPVDLDIITGESPGGQFRCKLCLQKKGTAYRNNEVPPFQLAPTPDTPPGVQPWKGVQ